MTFCTLYGKNRSQVNCCRLIFSHPYVPFISLSVYLCICKTGVLFLDSRMHRALSTLVPGWMTLFVCC
uniref:Putative ovule protein n=1 Tax=Solanum chacoense TaxID=4108 RepID=A0A0V0GV79_SOLCH